VHTDNKSTVSETAFRSTLDDVHDDRKAGNLEKAARSYQSLHAIGPSKISVESALWLADLAMVKGDILGLFEMNRNLTVLLEDHGPALQGEHFRLLGLTYFYLFDFNSAENFFELANTKFIESGLNDKIELAETNSIELYAHLDPELSIRLAKNFIEHPLKSGTNIELGKIYTALGWAHIRTNEFSKAETCFESANIYYTQSKYWLGKKRNAIAFGYLELLIGRESQGKQKIANSIDGLFKSSAYPSLILLGFSMLNGVDKGHDLRWAEAIELLRLPKDIDIQTNIDAFLQGLMN